MLLDQLRRHGLSSSAALLQRLLLNHAADQLGVARGVPPAGDGQRARLGRRHPGCPISRTRRRRSHGRYPSGSHFPAA